MLRARTPAPGARWIWVLYDVGGARLWHLRWVAGRVACTEADFVVYTPDRDMYVERYDGSDPGISAFRFSDVSAPPPPGIPRANTYRFQRVPTLGQEMKLLEEAAVTALEHFEAMNLGEVPASGVLVPIGSAVEVRESAGPAAVAPAASPPLPPVGDRVWVAVERIGQVQPGMLMTPGPGSHLHGEVGVIYEQGSAIAVRLVTPEQRRLISQGDRDARILSLDVQSSTTGVSRRRRTWREVCDMLREDAYPDWPVPGPRTVKWCCMHINRRGGGPQDHHRSFRQAYGLQTGDWGVDAHGVALRSLEEGGLFDGLELCNLASLEVTMRHAQLVEYVYVQEAATREVKGGKGKGRMQAGLLDEASVFSGTHRETGEAMICPALLDYVAAEVERDASVMKQVRKAREERRLLAKPAAKEEGK